MGYRARRPGERWRDRIIGIVIGIVLGIAIVAAFVFGGGDETIDAPSLESEPRTERTRAP